MKAKIEKKPKRMFNVRFSEDVIDWIEQRAEQERRTKTAVLLAAITLYKQTKIAS